MRLSVLATTIRRTSQFAGVKDRAKYVPRRAMLYVPASNQKMLDKVANIRVGPAALLLSGV